eukprot:PhF_6_TR29951/c0_g1_i1/m.43879
MDSLEFDFYNQDTWKDCNGVIDPDLLGNLLKYAELRRDDVNVQDYCTCVQVSATRKGTLTWNHIKGLASVYEMCLPPSNFHDIMLKHGSIIMGVNTLVSNACLQSDILRRHASVSPSKDPSREFIKSLSRNVLRFDIVRVHVVAGESGSGKTYSAITECSAA